MKLAHLKDNYDKHYKKLMVIPFLILIISAGILGYWKLSNDEFVSKDVSLKGGLLITVQTEQELDIPKVEDDLDSILSTRSSVREVNAVGSAKKIGYIFELERLSDIDAVKSAITEASGLELIDGAYTIEEMSSTLGESFWDNTVKAIILAFVFMSIVVFYYFRKLPVSLAIILAAASDLIVTLAFINISGIKLSTAGVAALLMLIGYSVDSDILLSTKLVKRREGTLNDRIFESMKTGLTMQATTVAALAALWLLSPAEILKQIAIILLFGLLIDMINTWIQNVGILKWYLESRGVQGG